MENAVENKAPFAGPGFGESRGWWVVLGVLAVWHTLLTLGLFGTDQQAFANLADDRPIISGRHALHLYHGYLGGQSLRDRGRSDVYDPFLYAGYPKTPWFDTGSKPAELFLGVAGGAYQPAAYKLGVALTWALLPLILATAARAAGLNRGVACIAAFLTMMACWSDSGRQRLWAGDVDLILASALGILAGCLGLLYHRRPHVSTWLALTAVGFAVSFCQVLVSLALLPLAVLFYFGSGGQHRLLWHLGLLAAAVIVVLGNWFWLDGALRFWWIRSEPENVSQAAGSLALLEHLTHLPVLNQPMLLGLLIALLVGSTGGIVAMHLAGRALAGRLLTVGVAGFLLLGLLGEVWKPHLGIELDRFLFTALLLATLPAAQCVVTGFDLMGRVTGANLRGVAVMGGLLAAVLVCCHIPLGQFARHGLRQEQLPLGLPDDAQATVDVVQKQTTPEARLLWEESPEHAAWTPLLAKLTGRPCIGGLGPDANIEHAAIRLMDGRLAGRPLEEWADSELADYCRRYNVGWVACSSSASVERFGKWSLTGFTHELPGGGKLFTLRRPYSFVLTGRGQLRSIENNLITLTDLTPADGIIVLSFHYHPGIIPSADRVRLEKEPQLYGGIPFVRLRLTGPMARLTLRWSGE